MSATTWYLIGNDDGGLQRGSLWSILSNWNSAADGSGVTPSVAPWTDATTKDDNLSGNPVTIDIPVGSADGSWTITGSCDNSIFISSTIYDGTFLGTIAGIWGNNIYGGYFASGYSDGLVGAFNIYGGTFTGDFTLWGSTVYGGTFSGSVFFQQPYQVDGGIFTGSLSIQGQGWSSGLNQYWVYGVPTTLDQNGDGYYDSGNGQVFPYTGGAPAPDGWAEWASTWFIMDYATPLDSNGDGVWNSNGQQWPNADPWSDQYSYWSGGSIASGSNGAGSNQWVTWANVYVVQGQATTLDQNGDGFNTNDGNVYNGGNSIGSTGWDNISTYYVNSQATTLAQNGNGYWSGSYYQAGNSITVDTWYWQGGVDGGDRNADRWSTLGNWWSGDAGTGVNPVVPPWTDVTTAGDNITLSSTAVNLPTIDSNLSIGASDASWSITGACDISNFNSTSYVQGNIYDGTWTGGGFNNLGTIYGGDFSGADFNNQSGSIYGGTFSGDGFTNWSGLIYGGTFTGTNFNPGAMVSGGTFTQDGMDWNYVNIVGGLFLGSGLYVYGGSVIHGATFSGSGMTVDQAFINSGTFTGDGLTLGGACITNNGTFVLDNLTHNGSVNWQAGINDGTFICPNFHNSGTIYGGTFIVENFTNDIENNPDAGIRTWGNGMILGGTFSGGMVSKTVTGTTISAGASFTVPNHGNSSIGVLVELPELDIIGTGGL